MIKPFAKYLLAKLPRSLIYEISYQAARNSGIRGFMVDGVEGPFLGAVSDRAIMRTYLLEKNGRLS